VPSAQLVPPSERTLWMKTATWRTAASAAHLAGVPLRPLVAAVAGVTAPEPRAVDAGKLICPATAIGLCGLRQQQAMLVRSSHHQEQWRRCALHRLGLFPQALATSYGSLIDLARTLERWQNWSALEALGGVDQRVTMTASVLTAPQSRIQAAPAEVRPASRDADAGAPWQRRLAA